MNEPGLLDWMPAPRQVRYRRWKKPLDICEWAKGVIFVYQPCDITIVVVTICVLWWLA